MSNEYIEQLNNGSIYKADLITCENIFSKIQDFEPETMMKMPGCVSITAMTGAGKTILIKDLLKRTEKHWKEVHLVSRTAKMQSIYNFVPRENIQESWNEEYLMGIFNSRKSKKEKDNDKDLDPILIIFDDIINDTNYKKSLAINNLFTEGRHYNISIWFLTQNFTSLKMLQRNNVRWAISFCHDTAVERRKFSDSYMSTENERVARLLFNKITKAKAYQCVVVEVYKVGVEPHEKIKKYIADANIGDPVIEPIIKQSVLPAVNTKTEESTIIKNKYNYDYL